jgi:hypothetical protein
MLARARERNPGEKRAFWLTYVPPEGNFSKYDDAVQLTRSGRAYDETWQCKFDALNEGERVFIMRQGNRELDGVPSRGIVARGVTTSATYKGRFNRDGTGKDTFRVSICIDSVIGPDELPLKDPFYPVQSGKRFSGPAYSGFRIQQELLEETEAAWAARFDIGPRGDSPELRADRDRILRNIFERRGQPKFREALVEAYDGRCAVTGCSEVEALEAAHIVPCAQNGEDRIRNGLLLRADIHTLFDLNLIRIDPERRVELAPEIASGSYRKYEGQTLKEDHVVLHLRAGDSELRWRWNFARTTQKPVAGC